MTREEELDLRRRQLKARENRMGFERNVKELQKRIAELESD